MVFEHITPEAAGISSKKVKRFIEKLESRGAMMHSIMMFRHGKVFAEHYWAPFNENSLNRMYSQTKSYCAIALGLLRDEGKLTFDQKIAEFFPDKINGEIPEHLKELTVENMLTMTTAGAPINWFEAHAQDRVDLYFNHRSLNHVQNTVWRYDSAGSQVLGVLAERLSGMKLIDYLRKKLFNKMGTFQNARVLMTGNGDSWGDSALLCTTRDMASGGLLLLNNGVYEGEQLLSQDFVREATSPLKNNMTNWFTNSLYGNGYGYQIWRYPQNSFGFVGMGDQLTICVPDKDFMFVCTADHQSPKDTGNSTAMREMLITTLYDLIVDELCDAPLSEDKQAYDEYRSATADLKLHAVKGAEDSPIREKINGVTYECDSNDMGITKFTFKFNDKASGEFCYTNAQGDKVIPFGVNHNVFGKFPHLGYSSEHGEVPTTDGFMYDDAVSLAWIDENKLILNVKIIDKYLGAMSAVFGFNGEYATAHFEKAAEYFLEEYMGWLTGKVAK